MGIVRPVGSRCRVSVPGSTSNLGPGFDTIGCALQIRNSFELERLPERSDDKVDVSGIADNSIPRDASNMVLLSARRLFDEVGAPEVPLRLHCDVRVPNSRGLGSSSTAIVGGLLAANGLLSNPLPKEEVLRIAIDVEGHPDNVAPGVLGGMIVFATESDPPAWLQLDVHQSISFVFVIPEYRVETSEARRVLPREVPFNDAIYNASRTPLLILALHQGVKHLFPAAMEDRLHQNYRRPLYRGFKQLQESAIESGALGFCVSGAGPAMLAVCEKERVQPVIEALKAKLVDLKIEGAVKEIAPDNDGARVECEPVSVN